MKTADNDDAKNSSSASSNNSPLRSLVAGAAAGAFSKTVTAPIERVKLLLQLRPDETSVRQVVRDVYRQEGLLAFWRGNTPSVIQKAGNSALNFMLMDFFKQTISGCMTTIYGDSYTPSQSTRMLNSLLSGGLSGATTTTLLYPLEFLRTRLAVDINKGSGERRHFRGMRDVVVYTHKTDGFRGMYKGYGTSICYVAMHRVVYLGGFDVAKMEVLQYTHKDSLSMTERVAIAQSVSLLAAAVCYPLDTVRRQLMMQAGLQEKQFTTTWACAQSIHHTQGMRGFFKGLGPNLAKTVGGALLLVAYDSFRGVM